VKPNLDDLPIALRKWTRSSSRYPIFHFVSTTFFYEASKFPLCYWCS